MGCRARSTSANFSFGQFRLRPISASASWPKSNWPKSSILGPSPLRRHSRCCLELLCHTSLCHLTRSVRSSFLREPPGSFHSGFCRVRSRQSSAGTIGHCDLLRSSCTTQCLRRSELGRSTLARLGCCPPRTCTQPVLVHFIPNLVSERFHGYFILSFPQNIGDQRRWFLEDISPRRSIRLPELWRDVAQPVGQIVHPHGGVHKGSV